MRTIEIPLSGHDKGRDETYSDYLIRLTARMHAKALELHEERAAMYIKGNMTDFEALNRQIKDEVEKLISVINERDHITD